MPRVRTDLRPATAGFTLLEVLLAITITGFVLAAATTMVVAISNIWVNRQDSHFFEDHVDGVSEFIQSCFSEAGIEIALNQTEAARAPGNQNEPDKEKATNPVPFLNNAEIKMTNGRIAEPPRATQQNKQGTGLIRVSREPIDWARPPGFASFREPLIHFRLREQPPLLVNVDNAPASGVDTFLYFDAKEGLSLLWHSILQEAAEDEKDLRRTLLSPYVKDLRYIYWDERFERWEEDQEPREGEKDAFILPRFIKLLFSYEGVAAERTLALPVTPRSALIF